MSSQDSTKSNNVGLVEPSQASQDSLLSHPIEQDEGVSNKDNQGYGGLAAARATAVGACGVAAGMGHQFQKSLSNGSSKTVHNGMRSISDPEVHNRSYTESEGKGFALDINRPWIPILTSLCRSQHGHKIYNTVVGANDIVASHPVTQSVVSHPVTQKATETVYGLKDTAASKLGYVDQVVSTDSTPVSEKAIDCVVKAKDSAASNLSANDEPKPVMDRMTESAYGLKDTIALHPVIQKVYDLKDIVVSHPITRQATNYVVQGKNYVANQLNYANQALSFDNKPISAKTYEGATQARDTTVQKTAPDHHDKALADSVTESISSLPSLLTSKLGLGDGTTTNSPTTASTTPTADASTFDPSTRKDTPFPDHSAATAPGLLDRVSDLALSLFGGAAKQPATYIEGEKPASIEKYIP